MAEIIHVIGVDLMGTLTDYIPLVNGHTATWANHRAKHGVVSGRRLEHLHDKVRASTSDPVHDRDATRCVVAIFTNQAWSAASLKAEVRKCCADTKTELENFFAEHPVGVPCSVELCLAESSSGIEYKPMPGMWRDLKAHLEADGATAHLMVHIGDACTVERPEDYWFARNCGARFVPAVGCEHPPEAITRPRQPLPLQWETPVDEWMRRLFRGGGRGAVLLVGPRCCGKKTLKANLDEMAAGYRLNIQVEMTDSAAQATWQRLLRGTNTKKEERVAIVWRDTHMATLMRRRRLMHGSPSPGSPAGWGSRLGAALENLRGKCELVIEVPRGHMPACTQPDELPAHHRNVSVDAVLWSTLVLRPKNDSRLS